MGAILHAGLIYTLSSQPGSGIPVGGVVMNLCHAPAFGGLAFWVSMAAGMGRCPSRRAAAVGVLVAAIYGILDEWHQSMVPGRQPDPLDVAIDVLGAVTAVVILIQLFRKERPSRIRYFTLGALLVAIVGFAFLGA